MNVDKCLDVLEETYEMTSPIILLFVFLMIMEPYKTMPMGVITILSFTLIYSIIGFKRMNKFLHYKETKK